MDVVAVQRSARLPRFRRASESPAFRLTDDDVEIIRQVAQHRLIRSTHIASLVGRSLDRTNDRLRRLFHAGYVDRPRAQLDRFPTDGSAPMVYSLADRGARLLCQREGLCCGTGEWSRKNREAGRPFIEHQIEIVDFQVALQRAVSQRSDVQLITAEEMIAASRQQKGRRGALFALRAKLSHQGWVREASVVPDLVFGLQLTSGKRLNFMVEIDRGTMPVRRSDPDRTSFEQKMRVYLTAHATKQHERQLGWKNFRVLAITTAQRRMQSMKEALVGLRVPGSPGASLLLFSTLDEIRAGGPLAARWADGNGQRGQLA
jgi:hypothetical protein